MVLKHCLGSLPLYLLLFPLLDHLCTSAVLALTQKEPENSEVIAPSFWERLAKERLKRTNQIFSAPRTRAKNVILFLGDGMGIPTISAGRFFKAEVEGRLDEANPLLNFEDWPFHTMCRTYDLQTTVTDSASSATAYLGGTKTLTGVIGLTGAVGFRSCRKHTPEEKVESVLEAAMEAGMATGIVTTSRVTHASPAGAYAHTASRQWESDRQLVEENLNINVVLGGGSRTFFPVGERGERLDGRNLAKEWLANQTSRGRCAKLITDASQFMLTDFSKVDYLLGLLGSSHLPFDADRGRNEPSLANLTTVAIKVLFRHPKGFFLFVEGARIDHAHHSNSGKKALLDLLAFEDAVRAGTQMVNLEETLVIVTADHSHSFMLVGGQPDRKRSLLDVNTELAPFVSTSIRLKAITTSSSHPAFSGAVNTTRLNLTALSNATLHDIEFQQPAFVPLPWATHGGEDVGVYATGVFSYLFHSTVDNTFVGQAMKYALCLRPFEMEPHCPACGFTPNLLMLAFSFLFSQPMLFQGC
ncbi:unnamed protein product [Taenia asiatica]|uniref:Alkaline phosphatase n=1 Tax=Taenia asiatica TaxID=60517 RepID=A0A0R3W2Q4_TAEAS|nr:unnamed protein product [Taenia asiatica]